MTSRLRTRLRASSSATAPSLNLEFATAAGGLDPRVTFSRTTQATLTDSTGRLTYAPNNLATNSESFEAASWAKTGTTAAANTAVAPDGTSTADTATAVAGASQHFFTGNSAGAQNSSLVGSIYFKAGTHNFVQLFFGGSATPFANFNLALGTSSAFGAGTTANIVAVGNGWYRCSVFSNILSLSSLQFALVTSLSAARAESWTAAGTETVLVWGAQLEAVTYQTTPGTYNSTTPKNLLGFTQEFDNAYWNKTNATVTANATTAPDGTLSADKLVGSAATGYHAINRAITGTVAPYVYSVYLKAAEYTRAILSNGSTGAWAATFDLSAGTVLTTTGGSILSAAISPVGDGWYRCSVTYTGSATSYDHNVFGYPVGATLNNFGAQYTGDGTSGIFAWGIQVSNSASVDPYVYNPAAAPTSAAFFGPRFDFDPVTLAPRGLLIEEQRTNLLLRSEEFDNAAWIKSNVTVTANSTAAPDGTNTADTVTPTAADSNIRQEATPSAANPHTFSIWLRSATGADFSTTLRAWRVSPFQLVTSTTITVTPTWQRFTLTFTPLDTTAHAVVVGGSSTLSTGENLFAWGAQLEAGAFATSYIPTVASQVTRTADVASMLGANFSSWYNQTQGTFVAQASSVVPVVTATYAAMSVNDNTGSNRSNLLVFNGQWGGVTSVSGVDQANLLASGSYTTNAVANVGYAYAANNFAFSVNGRVPLADTVGSVPSVDRLFIGSAITGGGVINGHVRSITYYPTRLTNVQLQAITA